ncbi:anti-sigma factor [Dongia sp.]|uniref:anti-sigma factor family protein n=1 Tax=Dongia sp. TaxID=1977262 RepID=UPI0035B4F2DF
MSGADQNPAQNPTRPIGEDDLQAYIDNRLDAKRLAAVEDFIASQPDLARRIAAERHQRDTLRTSLVAKFAEPIPTRLRIAHLRAARRVGLMRQVRAVAAVIVLLLAGALGGWLARGEFGASETGATRNVTMALTRDAVSAYRTYVSEIRHPVEVSAAEEEHLVKWLSKRLGRPLQPPKLDAFGFQLMGGRLLPADDVAAAQFMYEHADGRRLTLYLRVGEGEETAFRFQQMGETATFAWVDQGCGFALTAAADRAQLLPIAEAVYRAYDGAWN